MSNVWFVYLVRAADGSLHCGISTDVERRVREHNEGWRGAKCLRGKRPVSLAWRSAGMTKSAALRLEARLEPLHPHWSERLAAEWAEVKRSGGVEEWRRFAAVDTLVSELPVLAVLAKRGPT